MTDIEIFKNMKKGDKVSVNNLVLKIKRVDNFEDDKGENWKLFYLEDGYKLHINDNKINFFRITELDEGDEFLESIRIESIEKLVEVI